MRAVQHKSFYMYKYEDDIIGFQCYDAPAMYFQSQNPALFVSEGARLLMLCPPAGLQKICDTPQRKSKTSAASGEHQFFSVPPPTTQPHPGRPPKKTDERKKTL